MKNRRKGYILAAVAAILLAAAAVKLISCSGGSKEYVEIRPEKGLIESIISSTGTVLPKNRLEIKPPVNGRIEEVLVREGEKVKVGETLVWMSSTERAALLDAARAKGPEALAYWKDAYKPIALISPIDGEVIVAKVQSGQTVTVNDAVIVLSDHLIIRSQVDETDIAKIKLGQTAFVTLDAYPETKIDAKVEHIYYESKTVNNVTIYEVDLNPSSPPHFIRSGMNASVSFIVDSKEDALVLPLEAVSNVKGERFVLLKEGSKNVEKRVETGITGEGRVEIASGLSPDDIVLVKAKKYSPSRTDSKSNPFMPMRRSAPKSK